MSGVPPDMYILLKVESLVLVLRSPVQISHKSLKLSLEMKFHISLEEKLQMIRFSSIHSPGQGDKVATPKSQKSLY
jgi:predicted transport protein